MQNGSEPSPTCPCDFIVAAEGRAHITSMTINGPNAALTKMTHPERFFDIRKGHEPTRMAFYPDTGGWHGTCRIERGMPQWFACERVVGEGAIRLEKMPQEYGGEH